MGEQAIRRIGASAPSVAPPIPSPPPGMNLRDTRVSGWGLRVSCMALPRVGLALRANLAASGRDRTTCGPTCLSRATLAGRGKALPCPLIKEGRGEATPLPEFARRRTPRLARSANPTRGKEDSTWCFPYLESGGADAAQPRIHATQSNSPTGDLRPLDTEKAHQSSGSHLACRRRSSHPGKPCNESRRGARKNGDPVVS